MFGPFSFRFRMGLGGGCLFTDDFIRASDLDRPMIQSVDHIKALQRMIVERGLRGQTVRGVAGFCQDDFQAQGSDLQAFFGP